MNVEDLKPQKRDLIVEHFLILLERYRIRAFRRLTYDLTGRVIWQCVDVPNGNPVWYEMTAHSQPIELERESCLKSLIMDLAQELIERGFDLNWSLFVNDLDIESDLNELDRRLDEFDKKLDALPDLKSIADAIPDDRLLDLYNVKGLPPMRRNKTRKKK